MKLSDLRKHLSAAKTADASTAPDSVKSKLESDKPQWRIVGYDTGIGFGSLCWTGMCGACGMILRLGSDAEVAAMHSVLCEHCGRLNEPADDAKVVGKTLRELPGFAQRQDAHTRKSKKSP